MSLGLFTFEPFLSPRLWGGQGLAAYGKALPPGQLIGESWELFDRPDKSARVAAGPQKGQTLRQLMDEYGPRLLGEGLFRREPASFPLMVKLIDAQADLSVQVHPDDEQAARMVGGDELGKSEMWVVLKAGPGARVAAGLKPGVDAAVFKKALQAGKVEEILQSVPVQAGDVIDIPAGRVHAIGAGCLVAEIQQNSDTTYRVWDFGRLENGKPRDLHVDEALRVINFGADFAAMPSKVAPQPLGAGRELLVENAYFRVERLRVDGSFKPAASEPRPALLLALRGNGKVSVPGSQDALTLGPGGFCLVPAETPWAIEAGAGLELLWARPA